MTMLQVRNLSASTHRTLKARAALAGLTLSDYVARELDHSAALPTVEEFFDATLALDGPSDAQPAAEILRQERDGR